MKLALITDIHANREAFEACLDDAERQGAETYALLGDFVGYGADPAWVVDRARELVAAGAIAVMGNHDKAVVNGPRDSMNSDARRAIEWTRTQLDAAQIDFLARLPYSVERNGCLFVHANAYAPQEWEYVTGRSEAVRSLNSTHARYTFAGHVHDPQLFNLSGLGKIADFTPTPGVAIPVPPHRQWFVLPGSAGQPRDGNPAACWAMFDSLRAELTFHRVPYHHEEAARKIAAAGLPARLGERLMEGS
ncbi:metallophosphoesterase family protein [Methyloversatilis sp.]|uniref:metallophosphoesterase family protein n=1 Tax=Methyloversatilis sp. TaxID=2569862 RepID=UPI003D265FA6